jgi:plasmid stabilization system protein ParE
MKVVFTEAALADLDDILSFIASHYPTLATPIEERIRAVIARVAKWPQSARVIEERPGVRVVPLVRYPYKVFYRIVDETIEILHIHHTSRQTTE